MTILLIILVLVAVVGLWLVAIYNKLVAKRQMVKEGWSGIDVQLKRRVDLVPNLVETVKGYMAHEASTLENVTAMRAKAKDAEGADPALRAKAEGALSAALANFFAVAENYPDLKASGNFADLQKSLSDIENEIQLSRRYYNGAVRDMNTLVQSFPSNLVANSFKFEEEEYFELENAADRNAPKVSF